MENEVLKVTKPFAWMEVGDTLKLSEDGKNYTNTFTDEYSCLNSEGHDIESSVQTTISFSKSKAEELIKSGHLAAETETPRINVFDEIDNMLETYSEDLANIDNDMATAPACMRVEKETVLRNMVKVLSHLKSLKY